MIGHAEKAGEPHALAGTSGSAVTAAGNGEQAGEQVLEALRCAHVVLDALTNPNMTIRASFIFFQATEAEVKVRKAIALASGGKA